jgi:hypothetical protein
MRMNHGNSEYCVIGEIQVQALRRFQSNHSSASKPYKSVPDGFGIDFDRKVLTVDE